MLTLLIEQTQTRFVAGAGEPPLVELAETLARRQLDDECRRIAGTITTANGQQSRLQAIKNDLTGRRRHADVFERYLDSARSSSRHCRTSALSR